MMDDYGSELASPQKLARAIVKEMREQEREFWITREVHHAQHLHLGRLIDIAPEDDERRRWVDSKRQAEERAMEDRRSLRNSITRQVLGYSAIAGIGWFLFHLADKLGSIILRTLGVGS